MLDEYTHCTLVTTVMTLLKVANLHFTHYISNYALYPMMLWSYFRGTAELRLQIKVGTQEGKKACFKCTVKASIVKRVL